MLLFFMYLQSLSQIMNASMEELARCPGIGERKVNVHTLVIHRNCKLPILSVSLPNPISLA